MYFTLCPISEISEENIDRVKTLLSGAQQDYLIKINEKKRVQSLAVRALLMLMLEKYYPHLSVSALCVEKSGKPYLEGREVFISLTHSGDFVGCALSERPIGIDVEKIRPVSERLISRACTDEEQAYVAAGGTDSFFTLWTLKESYIKAQDCGFSQITGLSFVKNGSIITGEEKIKTGKTGEYIWSVLEI